MSVLPIPISRKKNCRLELNVLPSNQTGLATGGSIMLSQKTIRGNFTDGQSRKTKQKFEEICSQVVFAILIPAKLTQI